MGRGSRDYYLNETIFANHLNAYRKYIHDVTNVLMIDDNVTLTDEYLNETIVEMVEFEKKLAKVCISNCVRYMINFR